MTVWYSNHWATRVKSTLKIAAIVFMSSLGISDFDECLAKTERENTSTSIENSWLVFSCSLFSSVTLMILFVLWVCSVVSDVQWGQGQWREVLLPLYWKRAVTVISVWMLYKFRMTFFLKAWFVFYVRDKGEWNIQKMKVECCFFKLDVQKNWL